MGEKGERGTCLRTCLRYSLIVANIIVTLLGLTVLAVGIWSKVRGNEYIDVTEGDRVYTQVPILIIIVSIFVFVLGVVGVVGAVFANHVAGRIILGLYGFVLTLLVIIEIAGFITALVEKDQFRERIESSINGTFLKYNDTEGGYKDTWNAIQRALKCCGTDGYASYEELLDMDPPTSCCVDENDCDPSSGTGEGLFQEGCSQKVKDGVNVILGVIAGVVAVAIILKLAGIFVSCYVAIRGPDRGNYEFV